MNVTSAKQQANRKYAKLRADRRALKAALPAPEKVLKLVRYENMRDRQLHRVLAQLDRRHRSRQSDPASPEPPE